MMVQPAELDKRLKCGPAGLAVGAGRVDGLEQVGFFRAGEDTHAGRAAGVAHGQADHVGGLLLAVGIA